MRPVTAPSPKIVFVRDDEPAWDGLEQALRGRLGAALEIAASASPNVEGAVAVVLAVKAGRRAALPPLRDVPLLVVHASEEPAWAEAADGAEHARWPLERERIAGWATWAGRAAAASAQRRALEHELAEERAAFDEQAHMIATLFEDLPALVSIRRGPEQIFELANRAYREHSKRDLAEIIGKPFAEVYPASADKHATAHASALDHTRSVTRHEVLEEAPRGDGTTELRYYDISHLPLLDARGQPARVLSFSIDVTEKVEARERVEGMAEQLRASEQRWRFLAEASRRLAGSMDVATALPEVARMAIPELADWVVVDLVESGQLQRLAVAHADPAKEALAAQLVPHMSMSLADREGIGPVIRAGHPVLAEHVDPATTFANVADPDLRARGRNLGVCSALVVPLVSHGQTVGALSLIMADSQRHFSPADVPFVEDLARRMATAVVNARLYQAAQQASRAKDEFLAVVSHELRTPLTSIIGWSRILSTSPLDEARRAKAIAVIDRNARAQAQLIEDVLDLSRIVAGRLTLDRVRTEPLRFIEAAVEACRPVAAAKQVGLDVQLPAELPVITADPKRLEQVVWNLLSNALKFTPAGGRVVLSAAARGDEVEISVADTGEGIATQYLPFVFERFSQADASVTRQHGGLGLGLAICRNLVELHGGRIWAQSEGVGLGATFTVRVPRGTGSGLKPRSAADPRALLSGRRLLVVDGDAAQARDLRLLLESHGARTHGATDADAALQELEEQAMDAIVVSLELAPGDGHALLQRLRVRPATRGGLTPALALGWSGNAEEPRRAAQSGYQQYLARPSTPTQIIDALRELLGLATPEVAESAPA